MLVICMQYNNGPKLVQRTRKWYSYRLKYRSAGEILKIMYYSTVSTCRNLFPLYVYMGGSGFSALIAILKTVTFIKRWPSIRPMYVTISNKHYKNHHSNVMCVSVHCPVCNM